MIKGFIERRKEKLRQEQLYERVVSEVLELPEHSAKDLFSKVSEAFGNQFWIKSECNGDFEKVQHLLPSYLRDFFDSYPLSDFSYSELTISRNDIKQSELDSGCLCIGEEGFVGEVVIRPEKEDIYILYNDDHDTEISEYFEEGSKSIYNFIIDRLCINDKICEFVKRHLETI